MRTLEGRAALIARCAALVCCVLWQVPATADTPDPALVEQAKREANKKVVLAFYEALARFDFEGCRKYLGDYYIQHNPTVEDGVQGLEKAVTSAAKMLGPTARNKNLYRFVLAEGDYVITLIHSTLIRDDALGNDRPNRGSAVADIFRLEDGKIVEHWDAAEAIPEKLRNTGMF